MRAQREPWCSFAGSAGDGSVSAAGSTRSMNGKAYARGHNTAMADADPYLARRVLTFDEGAEVVIRPIEAGDSVDELTGLLHRAYRELAEMGFRFFASHQTSEQTAKRIAGARCWVAVTAGRLVGTVCLSDDRRKHDSRCAYYQRPGVWTCNQFAVEPALRRRGIGAAMMEVVEGAA